AAGRGGGGGASAARSGGRAGGGSREGLGGVGGGPRATADAAGERLARLGQRVVLVLDTYEVLRLLDGWLRQDFVPALRDNTRLVVAGREPPVTSWYAAQGMGQIVSSVQLVNLSDDESEELLTPAGLAAAAARHVNRVARGHPLSLELAAAAARARPDVDLEDIALRAALDELTGLYLDGLDPTTRQALDDASVVRRITLPLLEAMLPALAPQDAHERLRSLPFVQLEHDGLVLHDTIRETVARALRGSDPVAHRRYRAATWRRLRSDVAAAAPAELWRYTADMLYLIEEPD